MFNKTISFNNEVAIATKACAFVNTVGSGTKQGCHLASWIVTYERWKIVSLTKENGPVKFGEPVGFENQNFKGQFLSGFDSPVVVTQNLFQVFEQWILVPVDPRKVGQPVQNCDEFYIQLVNNGKFVGVNPQNADAIPLVNEREKAARFQMTLLQVV